MIQYRIKLSYPGGMRKSIIEKTAFVKIKITKDIEFIYNAIALFEDEFFKNIQNNLSRNRVEKWIELSKIRNIHDKDGIRDIRKVKRMLKSLDNRRHILSSSGMPNIKIFKARDNKLYIFDGHHSMLAYMMSGKKYLNEMPYLLFEKKDGGYILDDNFKNFFGKHLKYKRREKWGSYTVNWQAPRRKQLCTRAQSNMGELFKAVEG